MRECRPTRPRRRKVLAAPERYAPEQEVRFAVVLYGGVSLAVYMYGVVEELYHLVRASAPSRSYADGGDPPHTLHVPKPEGVERVYRKLARLLPAGGSPEERERVRTRFVVDILSGTSAGGINGVCLAKALANDCELEKFRHLRNVWLETGDIGKLIDDKRSDGDPPTSLLNGRMMLGELLKAMRQMNGDEGRDASPLVDELDLWVTSTDLEGLRVPTRVKNATAEERRHANRFHFRYRPGQRDDFCSTVDGFLAYAARSTSAFPFAFAPAVLRDLGLDPDICDNWQKRLDQWDRLHPDYVGADRAFDARAFGDGGILDNKPFSYATSSLVERRALLPVDRKVVYIEPDPAPPVPDAPPSTDVRTWNAFQTSQAAVLTIPRVETIREDIQALVQRNRSIERMREVALGLGRPSDAELEAVELVAKSGEDWGERGLSGTIADRGWGPTYSVYHRLKVRGVVDWLARVLAEAGEFDPESDLAFALHQVVRAWKEMSYSEDENEEDEDERASENLFLLDFDVPYRLRRIDFLLEQVKRLASHEDGVALEVLRAVGIEGELPPCNELRSVVVPKLRGDLTAARHPLVEAERGLTAKNGIASVFDAAGLSRPALMAILAAGDDKHMVDRAKELVKSHRGAYEGLVARFRDAFREPSDESRRQVLQALPSSDVPDGTDAPGAARVQAALRRYFDRYEAYDLALYPLQFGTELGETNPVDVVRVSPLDAKGPWEKHQELLGKRVGHFGGFLDERWREHDILWGRLDAAECLIRALVENESLRSELIDEAQRAIIEEHAADHHVTPDKVRQSLRPDARLPELVPETTKTSLTRGQGVVGRLVGSALAGEQAADDAQVSARHAAAPLAEAVFAKPEEWKAARRRALWGALGVLSVLPKVRLVTLALALLVVTPAVLAAIYCPNEVVRGIAHGVIGFLVLLPLLLFGGVYWGLGKLREAIGDAGWRAVTKQPDEEMSP